MRRTKIGFAIPGMLLMMLMWNCVPKDPVTLRAVNINEIVPQASGDPILKAEAVFYNPNTSRMRLKKIDIEIMVDGKKAAVVDQKMNELIKAQSEFKIPLEVQLNLKEVGLLDTILSFLGGKKHDIQFIGTIKLKVNGFPVKAPVNLKEQFSF